MKSKLPIKSHIGKKYGRLYIKNVVPYRKTLCVAICDCGVEKTYYLSNVIAGVTKSCGCLVKDTITSHGMSRTRLYRIWHGMRLRCRLSTRDEYVKNYQNRGITVCDRWQDFVLFAQDMGEPPTIKHSIDRIDNDKGYCPENCRWALPKDQMRNTRQNVYLEYRGEKLCISEWAEKLGITFHIISQRIRRGWDVEKTFNTPVDKKYSRNFKINQLT